MKKLFEWVKSKTALWQFIKFSLVGVLNTAVDAIVFFLLTRAFGAGEVLAQAISYPAGVINSFYFNSRFTFHEKIKYNSIHFVKFVIVNLISYGVSILTIYLITSNFSITDWAAKIFATVVAMVINFIGNKLVVFKK